MPGTARPDREPTRILSFRLPVSLHDELRLVMLDPRTGRPRYRTWGRTCEHIFREWLNAQKVTPP
jgi:hypothetical protein